MQISFALDSNDSLLNETADLTNYHGFQTSPERQDHSVNHGKINIPVQFMTESSL
jgi:hypothetical protein